MNKAIEQRLSDHKVKPTAIRLLVMDYLLKQEAAISLTDLYEAFEKSDRVTLYRTLKAFEERGIIHSIDDGTGAPKYALCQEGCTCDFERDLHVHFHCRVCGETFCLPRYKIPEINLPEKFKAEEANLVVKGVCDRCAG